MWPALKTSSSKSYAAFFRSRFLWIPLAAIVLSAILYWAFRLPDTPTEGEAAENPASAAEAQPDDESIIGVQPPSFQQITEYEEGSRSRLRLAGNAEPEAVIILTDSNGERLRQVRVNEQGQWGATLEVSPEPMAIYAELYIDENLPSIRSEETIFRLQVPDATTQALLMVTAPGSPSRIIQSPFGGVPTSGPLGLSVIDYDHAGGVIITGTSSVPGRIRIYAQDAVIGETGIGVSGRWNYIAGRMLLPGRVVIRAELIAAQGIPNAPEGPIFISVPFNLLPPLRAQETEGQGDLAVNIEETHWQIRRTLIGGGGQSTVLFAPQEDEAETDEAEEAEEEAEDK